MSLQKTRRSPARGTIPPALRTARATLKDSDSPDEEIEAACVIVGALRRDATDRAQALDLLKLVQSERRA